MEANENRVREERKEGREAGRERENERERKKGEEGWNCREKKARSG
jgi:hypothetical protein